MKQRNDWQAFYRQQVKAAGKLPENLHRLSEVLPPRTPLSKPRKAEKKLPYVWKENSSLGDQSQNERP